ncbi:LPXTG cell wall anchor domain-containing protein [Isoptericola aurantiacus]|uniref:LPXTG cell wall anchor domain-containing protein n=1 Tax=Isoptericola aurantiacus TaxID=3377839 RepID=UPI00383BEF94
MRTARRAESRALAALAVAAALTLGGTVSAAADEQPAPDPSASPSAPDPSASPSASEDANYPPDEEPTLDVEVLQPVCDGDVPYLQYQVDVENPVTPPEDVTITWLNPDGDDVVMADQPLSGRVLWPGAEVDGAGNALDWPGWRLVDGEWVVGDEWDWVRPSVRVLFEVNPEAEVTVSYPESTPECAGPQEPTIDVDVLTPLCITGVAYLDYAVSVTGTPNDRVTIRFNNPDGKDFVYEDQPLAGRLLWPGAYPERFVELSADDGWELVNNMWQNTRDFGWAVGTVQTTFTVNPEVTVPVTFPQDTDNCYETTPPPPTDPGTPPPDSPPELPRTGAQIGGVVALAVGLFLAGLLTIMAVRRRHTSE